ncbi:MAG: glycosyltransferase family 4 protein [Elusimicrobiaceae bacterium]|nr:glycosyltransferase family 4 protein [Elusimicrobiaceae bacterium]
MIKRILIITESLALGGAETIAVNLANALCKNGYTAGLAAHPGPLAEKLDKTVSFFYLPKYSFAAIVEILRTLEKTILTFRPDIIHCNNATHCLLVKLLLKLLGTKETTLILTYHSNKTTRMPNCISGPIFNRMTDRIIAIAGHRKKTLLALGVEKEKLFSIPNFIDLEQWNIKRTTFSKKQFRKALGLDEDAPVLLTAGRLIQSKRINLFLEITAAIIQTVPATRAIVVGDGPELNKLKNFAVRLGIGERVVFAGLQQDMASFYLGADVFVFPSEHEVLPMVLIEAGTAGLPAVASNIPGNDEIVIDGKTGFLISGTAEDYTHKIKMLLDNPDMRAKFSANALAEAGRFDDEVCVKKILEIYDR